jgi:hypothetical protein
MQQFDASAFGDIFGLVGGGGGAPTFGDYGGTFGALPSFEPPTLPALGGFQGFNMPMGPAFDPASFGRATDITVGAPPAPTGTSWMSNLFGTDMSAKDLFGAQGIIPGLTSLATGGLAIEKAIQDANYQKALDDYRKQQLQYQSQYAKDVQDYLTQRSAYEQQLLGIYGGEVGAVQDALTGFTSNIQGFLGQATDLMNTQLQAAMPSLQAGQQLTQQGVAALVKGDVPPEWSTDIEQMRQRTLAAAAQGAANEGADPQAAQNAVSSQLDQDVRKAMLAIGQQIFATGQAATKTGLEGTQLAGQTIGTELSAVQAGLDPYLALLQTSAQSLGGLFGGFPQIPIGPTSPAPPTA